MSKRKSLLVEGSKDKFGRKIVAVAGDFYRDEDGVIRDSDGYEWYGDSMSDDGLTDVDAQRIEHDNVNGEKVVVRDFKIAMLPNTHADPKSFIEHYRKTIEQTMVETGWDYANDRAIKFGEAKDGYVHIFVTMKKKAWRNRENMYEGIKQGQSNKVKSKALENIGAVDPHIYGVAETEKQGGDIIAGK